MGDLLGGRRGPPPAESLLSLALAGGFFASGATWEALGGR